MRVWAARLRAFGQLPLPDAMRRGMALGMAAAFVAAAALILLVISPNIPAPPRTPDEPTLQQAEQAAPDATAAVAAPETITSRDIRAAKKAARRFLTGGYLDYSYGRPVKKLAGATPELRQALAANPPRVPDNMRDRHARILTMQTEDARANAVPVLVTLIDKGDTTALTSSLTVLTERRDDRWIVTNITAG